MREILLCRFCVFFRFFISFYSLFYVYCCSGRQNQISSRCCIYENIIRLCVSFQYEIIHFLLGNISESRFALWDWNDAMMSFPFRKWKGLKYYKIDGLVRIGSLSPNKKKWDSPKNTAGLSMNKTNTEEYFCKLVSIFSVDYFSQITFKSEFLGMDGFFALYWVNPGTSVFPKLLFFGCRITRGNACFWLVKILLNNFNKIRRI